MSSIGRISSEKRPRADGHFSIVRLSATLVPALEANREFPRKPKAMNMRGVV